jgi:Cation transport ATPase
MLFTNLIMDTLGAIAIATEPYSKAEKSNVSQRVSRKDTIMKTFMYRQVFVMAGYQLLILLLLMYFGTFMFFDESFNIVTEPLHDNDGEPTDRLVNNTMVFHTFILMNWFNTLNCRLIDPKEINVFKSICNNPLMWFIMIFEIVIIQIMISSSYSHLGSAIWGTAPMPMNMHLISWGLGFSVIAVNCILKQLPLEKFQFAEKIDLESGRQNGFIDRFDAMFKRVTKSRDVMQADEEDDEYRRNMDEINDKEFKLLMDKRENSEHNT